MGWTFTPGSNTTSPRGFWPHPDKERFYRKQAPWKVPRKRKPQGCYYFYNYKEESVYHVKGAEVTTSNRFQVLSEEEVTKNRQDPSNDQIPSTEDVILPEDCSFYNFMMNNDKINNIDYYMYDKNKNFCSGYFPSFITLDDDKHYQISNNTSLDNIKDNYYLKKKIFKTIGE